MFEFLGQAKLQILEIYPWVDDFIDGKETLDFFLDNLKAYATELESKGFTIPEMNLMRRYARNYSKGLVYRKNEDPNLLVRRFFVLANEFKKAFPHTQGETDYWDKLIGLGRADFTNLYRKVYERVSNMPEREVDELILDFQIQGKKRLPERLARIKQSKWRIATIDTAELGVWPGFWGDVSFTIGNLSDTAKMVRAQYGKIPPKLASKFESMKKYADLIYRFFPILITNSGPKTRRVLVNDHLREKGHDFKFQITPYDVADGNHRAVMFGVMGVRRLQCFVGSGLKKDTLPLNIKAQFP